ncbi:MAG: GumC family protein [Armatimonadota bacterium]
MLLVFLAVFSLGLAVTLSSAPVYRASVRLTVPVPPSPKNRDLSGLTGNPLEVLLAPARPPSVAAQAEAISDPGFLRQSMLAAGFDLNDGTPEPSVEVEAEDGADVMAIAVEGRSPRQAAKLANEIARRHLERMARLQGESIEAALAFVQKERTEAARQVQRARGRLRGFRQVHPLERLTAEQGPRAQQRVEARTRLSTSRAALQSVTAELNKLRRRLAAEPLDASRAHQQANPQRALLLQKLGELQVERLQLLRDFQESSPEVQAVTEQIQSYRRQLEREPEAVVARTFAPNPVRTALETRLNELELARIEREAAFNAAVSEVRKEGGRGEEIGSLQLQADILAKEREAAESRFALLSERLQELEIRRVAQPYAAHVISAAAVPSAPIWPNKPLLLVISASLALVLGIGAGYLREHLDDRVHSSLEMESATALPALGQVPLSRAPLLPALPAGSELDHAYRMIRSWISFSHAGLSSRRLQITSPCPGEGKTTTSVNLAASLASDGKPVVLVDADLRRSRVHEVFGLPLGPGLAELLQDESLEPRDLLRPSGVPHLSILTAGHAAADPAELLSGPALDRVLAQLDEIASITLVDTPACLPVADPLILAGRMSGVVLVTGAARSRRADLARAREILNASGATVLGAILNGVRGGRGPHYSAYYGRSERGGGGGAQSLRAELAPREPEQEVPAQQLPTTW